MPWDVTCESCAAAVKARAEPKRRYTHATSQEGVFGPRALCGSEGMTMPGGGGYILYESEEAPADCPACIAAKRRVHNKNVRDLVGSMDSSGPRSTFAAAVEASRPVFERGFAQQVAPAVLKAFVGVDLAGGPDRTVAQHFERTTDGAMRLVASKVMTPEEVRQTRLRWAGEVHTAAKADEAREREQHVTGLLIAVDDAMRGGVVGASKRFATDSDSVEVLLRIPLPVSRGRDQLHAALSRIPDGFRSSRIEEDLGAERTTNAELEREVARLTASVNEHAGARKKAEADLVFEQKVSRGVGKIAQQRADALAGLEAEVRALALGGNLVARVALERHRAGCDDEARISVPESSLDGTMGPGWPDPQFELQVGVAEQHPDADGL